MKLKHDGNMATEIYTKQSFLSTQIKMSKDLLDIMQCHLFLWDNPFILIK